MIVLHAVTRSVPDDLDLGGLLQRRGHGLTVLYEHVARRPRITRQAVVEHGERIVRLSQWCSLLPIRYASVVDGLAALDRLVDDHAADWAERLDLVAGRCEVIVHVEWHRPPGPSTSTTSGRDYLLDRLATQRRRTELMGTAAKQVRRWSCEVRTLPDDRRIAALVPFGSVDGLRRDVRAWAARRSDVEVTVTGPWPPFSFCAPETPA